MLPRRVLGVHRLACSWDALGAEEEKLHHTAKHELSLLFAEVTNIYSSYLSLCNELHAKQSERRRARPLRFPHANCFHNLEIIFA